MEEKTTKRGKLKLLYLLEILRRETDEEHPMPASMLIEKLAERGIVSERKSIYRDMETLIEYGYEIIHTRKPRQGYFLAGRELEVPEVRLLLDAVASAPFITEKKTVELTEKLCGFLSQSQQKEVCTQLCVQSDSDRVKFDNEEVYYNIDALHRAIEAGKKVQFHYFHKVISNGSVCSNPGRSFTISPYAMLWSEDKYYLVGNYGKYDNLSNYRIDRMKRVEILEEDARPIEEVSQYEDQLDTADYQRSTFFMYGGEEKNVILSCKTSLLDAMVDRFGEMKILQEQEDSFVFEAKVRCSEGFFDWILRWGGQAVVLEPADVRASIAEKVKQLADAYGVCENCGK